MLFKYKKTCAVGKTAITTIALALFLLADTLIVVRDPKNDPAPWKSKVRSLFIVQEIYAKVLFSQQEALAKLLPDAQEIIEETRVLTDEQKEAIGEKAGIKFDPDLDREFHFFIGSANAQIVGYAVKDSVKGKWGLIHYMVSFDLDGKVNNVTVLEYREKRGRSVAKRRFLKQFFGKTINDRIKLKKDIDGVTGATISSRSMTNGIRKIVHIFSEFYPIEPDKL